MECSDACPVARAARLAEATARALEFGATALRMAHMEGADLSDARPIVAQLMEDQIRDEAQSIRARPGCKATEAQMIRISEGSVAVRSALNILFPPVEE